MPEQMLTDDKSEKYTSDCHSTKKWIWKKPIENIFLIKKPYDEDVDRSFIKMIFWILSQNRKVFVEQQVYEEEDNLLKDIKDNLNEFVIDKSQIDLVITIGGDGTILHANSLFQNKMPPLMPFHAGSLGFLTRFSLDQFESKIQRVLSSESSCVTYRSRLCCKLIRNDELEETIEYQILNDVVIERNLLRNTFLSNVDLYINDNYITTVQGDGMIIATPTGSTAYSSSAGASILHSNVKGNIITPICPHSLSFRPVVIPEDVDIKIKIAPESRNSSFISFDGRHRVELRVGDVLQLTSSPFSVPTLLVTDEIQDWFESLRSCLHWNDRQKQKPLKKI